MGRARSQVKYINSWKKMTNNSPQTQEGKKLKAHTWDERRTVQKQELVKEILQKIFVA